MKLIGNLIYEKIGEHDSKKKARRKAKEKRREGYAARVLPSQNGHAVWKSRAKIYEKGRSGKRRL